MSFRIVMLAAASVGAAAFAGPLDPPTGTISSTGRTLTEVEPRIPISSATTPGDANSVFRITSPGSYYLTGGISISTNLAAIEIAASNVTIDLNGFRVAQPTATSSRPGIVADLPVRGIIIRNGSVREFEGGGINLTSGGDGANSRIENVQAYFNGSTAFSVGPDSVILECGISNHTGNGLAAGDGSVVSNCSITDIIGAGMIVGNNVSIDGCSMSAGSGLGISAGSFANIIDTNIFDVALSGIEVGAGSTVRGCTVRESGGVGILAGERANISHCSVILSGLDGISAGAYSVIRRNNADSNGTSTAVTSAGISVTGGGSMVLDNHSTDNEVGFRAVNGGNCFFSNHATSNSVLAWSIAEGNVALIVNTANAGAILGDAGGTEPSASNPNPRANFTY